MKRIPWLIWIAVAVFQVALWGGAEWGRRHVPVYQDEPWGIQVMHDVYKGGVLPRIVENPWLALAPIEWEQGAIRWSATGFVPLFLLSQAFSLSQVILIMLLGVSLASFLSAWIASNNRPFTIAATILTACCPLLQDFYTHFGICSFGFFWIFAVFNLCALRFLLDAAIAGAVVKKARIGFYLSLIALALSWDMWLDWAAWIMLSCALGMILRWLQPAARDILSSRVLATMLGVLALCAAYLAARLALIGDSVIYGKESMEASLFNYPAAMFPVAIEDFLVNFFTYLYMCLSSQAPAPMTMSNSLWLAGSERILANKAVYGSNMQHLIISNHLFSWRFLAGASGLVFIAAGAHGLRRLHQRPSRIVVVLLTLMLLVSMGSAMHLIIKYIPLLSAPVMRYKTVCGIIGATVLFSAGFAWAWRRWSHRRLGRWALGCMIICLPLANVLSRAEVERPIKLKIGSAHDAPRYLVFLRCAAKSLIEDQRTSKTEATKTTETPLLNH